MTMVRNVVAIMCAAAGCFLTFVVAQGHLSGPGMGEVSVILHGGFLFIGTILAMACFGIAVLVWFGWKNPMRTLVLLGVALILPATVSWGAKTVQKQNHAVIYEERRLRNDANEAAHFERLLTAGADEQVLNEIFQSYQSFDIFDDGHDYGHAPGDVLFPAVFSVYVAVYTDLSKDQFFGFDRPGHNRLAACHRFQEDYMAQYDATLHDARFARVCEEG